MGKHFEFGDEGDVVTSKDNNDRENVGFQIDRRGGGGGNFSFGSSSGNRGRGRGDENSRGRGMGRGDWNSRGGGSRGRGGSFRGRGDGNFRGRGRGRGEGNFRGGRGRGGGGRFSKTFNSREDTEGEEREKLGVLPDELMAYYRQVSATVEAGFDDGEPELKKNFLDNVFIAVKAEGVKVSQNQTVSHILEGLLPHSLPAHLRTLFCEFCNHLPTVAFDRFASHVFQTLIQYIPDMYDDDQLEGEDKDSFKALVEKLCAYSLSEIQQFLTDTYGSHVLRSLLEVLGGVQVKEEVTRSHSSQNKRKEIGSRKNLQLRKNIRFSEKLSSDFQSKFDAIKSEVFTILKCEATDLLTDPNFCLVLQTILLILHQSNTTEYKEISQTLMERARPLSTNTKTDDDDGDEDDDNTTKSLPSIVQNSVGSYLIELLVSLSSPSDLRRLYDVIFKGTLSEYALHPVANYVLQKLCAGVASSPAIVTEMVCEVAPYMEDILACNHIGVITKMAEASLGNQALEKILTQAVMQAFHCDDTEEKRKRIAPLIASMTVYEVYFPSQTPKENEGEEKEEDDKGGVPDKSPPRLLKSVSIHGSLLLQQLIKFEKPKYLVTSLLALTPAELSNLASDQCGSHVVEAFFNSPTVWDKQKDDFVKKIQGYYITIACNKNGSRCLEGMWKGCGVKNKTFIAQELMKSRQRLESDRFGKFLWYNFKLMNFVTRQKDWISFQAGIKKKEKLLQEILEGSSSKKSKDGKRQADEANIGDVSTVQPKKKRKTGGDEEKPNKEEFNKEKPIKEEFNEEKPNKEEFKKQKHKKSKKGKS